MPSRSVLCFEDDILSIALAAEAQGLADNERLARLAQLLMKRWSKLSKSSKRLDTAAEDLEDLLTLQD